MPQVLEAGVKGKQMFKGLVMSEYSEKDQALIRACVEDHKRTGKQEYSREEMQALANPEAR